MRLRAVSLRLGRELRRFVDRRAADGGVVGRGSRLALGDVVCVAADSVALITTGKVMSWISRYAACSVRYSPDPMKSTPI